jgi:hypothetical protein
MQFDLNTQSIKRRIKYLLEETRNEESICFGCIVDHNRVFIIPECQLRPERPRGFGCFVQDGSAIDE